MLRTSEENILDIKSLSNSNPASMLRIVRWMDENFQELDEALNHFEPDPLDCNFEVRFHHRRGFLSALDTFRNLFRNPEGAIPREEKEKSKEDANAF